MRSYFCSYQEPISAAIQAGEWPQAAAPELRAHVESCATCNDLTLVAQTIRQSRAADVQALRLPAPGILWWRAQIRRRNAAIERMTRPIAIAEKTALLIVLMATVALVAWQYQQLTGWFAGIWGPLSNFAQAPGMLTLALSSLAIFAGFALYLLKSRD